MSETRENRLLPRGCRIIEFPQAVDSRGALSFAQGMEQIPFAIERVFWIYQIPEGETRGSHSHSETAEVVIPVNGSFDMFVSDGTHQTTVRMDSPTKGILIPPGVWCELKNFAPGTICVVCASHVYDASGYTNDYSQYLSEQISVVRYMPDKADAWNAFVAKSRNGTFLLNRGYMDYHADRFADASLMFLKNNELLAVLPASWDELSGTVTSHGGLTYGPLVISDKVTALVALQIFSCAGDYMKRELGATKWIYKPIPYIYASKPSEEDLYALFRCSGKLSARGVSSTIDQTKRLPMRSSRAWGAGKALKNGLSVRTGNSDQDLDAFWAVLEQVIMERHGKRPVHTVQEMRLLMNRFPENIHLHLIVKDNAVIAGSLVYTTDLVAHTQYLASNEVGRKYCALDLLLTQLIDSDYHHLRYFDFGISTENGGTILNHGLISQKEAFGGRAVSYDTYTIDL